MTLAGADIAYTRFADILIVPLFYFLIPGGGALVALVIMVRTTLRQPGKRPAIYIFPRRIAAEKMTPRRTTGVWVG